MKRFGVGITNENLRKIKMNNEQLAFDNTFDQVSHVSYADGKFLKGYFSLYFSILNFT